MGKSFTVTCDGDATPDAVTVPVRCGAVTLWTKDTDVTGGLWVYIKDKPDTAIGSITPALASEGERIVIASPAAEAGPIGGPDFSPGQVVAYLKSVQAGPFTVQCLCQ